MKFNWNNNSIEKLALAHCWCLFHVLILKQISGSCNLEFNTVCGHLPRNVKPMDLQHSPKLNQHTKHLDKKNGKKSEKRTT